MEISNYDFQGYFFMNYSILMEEQKFYIYIYVCIYTHKHLYICTHSLYIHAYIPRFRAVAFSPFINYYLEIDTSIRRVLTTLKYFSAYNVATDAT